MRSFLNRPIIWVVIAVAAILFIAAAWYLGSPLFINQTVNEAFPTNPSVSTPVAEIPADNEKTADSQPETVLAGEEETSEEAMSEETSRDAMESSSEPVLVATGRFEGADRAHQGEGEATIYELEDGSHILRFENFSVTNGPDLHVLVSEHPDPTNRDEVMMGYLDLGKIKGNLGDQNYTFPEGLEITDFQSVIIYCEPFHVIFATASLGGS